MEYVYLLLERSQKYLNKIAAVLLVDMLGVLIVDFALPCIQVNFLHNSFTWLVIFHAFIFKKVFLKILKLPVYAFLRLVLKTIWFEIFPSLSAGRQLWGKQYLT